VNYDGNCTSRHCLSGTYEISGRLNFVEQSVQRKRINYLRHSLYRAARDGFAYFGINDWISQWRSRGKQSRLHYLPSRIPNNIQAVLKPGWR